MLSSPWVRENCGTIPGVWETCAKAWGGLGCALHGNIAAAVPALVVTPPQPSLSGLSQLISPSHICWQRDHRSLPFFQLSAAVFPAFCGCSLASTRPFYYPEDSRPAHPILSYPILSCPLLSLGPTGCAATACSGGCLDSVTGRWTRRWFRSSTTLTCR